MALPTTNVKVWETRLDWVDYKKWNGSAWVATVYNDVDWDGENDEAETLAIDSVDTINIVDGAVTEAKVVDEAISLAKTKITSHTVTVLTKRTTWTATVIDSATVIWITSAWKQNQFIDDVAVAATTLTVTLAAAATATNTFTVTCIS
jgi:hypothetical protein